MQFFEQVAIDQSPARILMIDDDANLLKMVERTLSKDCDMTCQNSAQLALDSLDHNIDLVITDLWMPDMNGIQFIDHLRLRDPELPVIVVSGRVQEPDMNDESRRIFHFLAKPFTPHALRDLVKRAVSAHRAMLLKKRCEDLILRHTKSDRARYTLSETKDAIEKIVPFFQPIVSVSDESVVGHEALVRSKHTSINTAPVLFEAARKYNLVESLSRTMFEQSSITFARDCENPEALLFLNLAREDLTNVRPLVEGSILKRLREEKRICLEITEEARMTKNVARSLSHLRDEGYRLAIDDIGAGYAGLNSLALIEPDVFKIDMALVRDIDKSRPKQRLVEALISVANGLHIQAIGEGVETLEESKMLSKLGCDWQQGYFFGKPHPKLSNPVKFG